MPTLPVSLQLWLGEGRCWESRLGGRLSGGDWEGRRHLKPWGELLLPPLATTDHQVFRALLWPRLAPGGRSRLLLYSKYTELFLIQ